LEERHGGTGNPAGSGKEPGRTDADAQELQGLPVGLWHGNADRSGARGASGTRSQVRARIPQALLCVVFLLLFVPFGSKTS